MCMIFKQVAGYAIPATRVHDSPPKAKKALAKLKTTSHHFNPHEPCTIYIVKEYATDFACKCADRPMSNYLDICDVFYWKMDEKDMEEQKTVIFEKLVQADMSQYAVFGIYIILENVLDIYNT